MLERFKSKRSALDEQIDRINVQLATVNPGTQDYDEMFGRLERAIRLKKEERSNRVSPDTIVMVAGNLLGIGIIVGYERFQVMGSRALGLLMRTKQP
jgi:hypothetical protein